MKTADFELNVPLMSKARPRSPKGGGRPYMPKAYMDWKANVRAILGEWWTVPPLEKVSALVLVFRGQPAAIWTTSPGQCSTAATA